MKKKICIVTSTPGAIKAFWKTNIDEISKKHDVFVVTNFEDKKYFEGINIIDAKSIAIERRPALLKDIKALWKTYKYFRKMKFDAFISMTDKASLISSIAGFFARIPVRVRVFTGQTWAHKKGAIRFFYKMIDRTTVLLNTHSCVDGKPQRAYLEENKIFKSGYATVIANGSICGVDINRFKASDDIRKSEREKFNIKDDDVVYTFMGRINRDKGIYELLGAFNKLCKEHNKARLVLIGSFEGLNNEILSKYPNISVGKNTILYGFTSSPEKALQISDVFCLPSYREGFGMSAIEAAAVNLPVICSDAYGMADTFVEGVTGLKCKVADEESLFDAMKLYYDDSIMRRQHGQAGRNRIVELFPMDLVSKEWAEYIDGKLNK